MAEPRDSAYVWVTWITGLMSGDRHCAWASWFRAHHLYEKVPSDFDLDTWRADHEQLLRQRADELRGEGFTLYIEEQNAFRLQGREVPATLAGKPDIVAVRDGEGLVIDCKTGRQRPSDYFQVVTYLLALPHCLEHCKGVRLRGEICYRSERRPIDPRRLTQNEKARLREVMALVGSPTPPRKVPSLAECRLCDIPASECPDRVEDAPPPAAATGHDLF